MAEATVRLVGGSQPPSRHPRLGKVSAIAVPAMLAPAAISTAVPQARVMSNRCAPARSRR